MLKVCLDGHLFAWAGVWRGGTGVGGGVLFLLLVGIVASIHLVTLIGVLFLSSG